MIKNYINFLNEKLSDKLSGFNEEDLRNQYLNGKIDAYSYYNICINNNFNLPTNEEIKQDFLHKKIDLYKYIHIFVDNDLELPKNDLKHLFINGKINIDDYFSLCKTYNLEKPTTDELYNLIKDYSYLDIEKYINLCQKYGFKVSKEYIKKLYLDGYISVDKYYIICNDYGIKLPSREETHQAISNYTSSKMLKYACMYDFLDLVKKSIDDVYLDSFMIDDIISIISDKCYIDIIKYLINIPEIKNEINKILIHLIKNNNIDVIKYLISIGGDIHINDEYLLIESINHNYYELFKFFVDNGADININNSKPLQTAVELRNYDIIKYLLQNGSKITEYIRYFVKNNNGFLSKKIIKLINEYDK